MRTNYPNTTTTYYPFGMLIKERAYSSDSYRFGFNGMEKVDEVSGEANNLDFGARIYDSRLGRFFSADPRGAEHFWHSSYSFAANSPIYYIDNNGEIPIPAAVFGAITGALSEALGQVGVFVLDKGMSLPDAFANVNMNDVFIAAGTGAITGFFDGGTSKFIKFVKSKRTQKLMKISALFILEIVEDVTKKYANGKDQDIMASIAGAFVEVGLGELMPDANWFKRKAKNAEKDLKRLTKKTNSPEFDKKSLKKQNRLKSKLEATQKEYTSYKTGEAIIQSISDGTAVAAANKAQSYFENKPDPTPSIKIGPLECDCYVK
jgi:RHS repeat-associated protein